MNPSNSSGSKRPIAPEDFPIGSRESRAAARAMMERAEHEAVVIRLVIGNVLCDEAETDNLPTLTQPSYRHHCEDGTIIEIVGYTEPGDNVRRELPSGNVSLSNDSPTRANAPDNDVLDRESEEAAREARVEEYGKSLVRRSRTRPSPQLRRAWWRHGLSDQ